MVIISDSVNTRKIQSVAVPTEHTLAPALPPSYGMYSLLNSLGY